MRNAFSAKLTDMVERDNNIILLTGDIGFSVFDQFKERFPKNYVNAGIAEANMIGMASGLALSGKRVVVYSIAPFIAYRAFEQVRNDLSYQKVPVTLVVVGGGLAYSDAGATHNAIEDLALMSSIPNMTVIAPGDPVETEYAVEQSIFLDGPCYIRLNKSRDTVVHSKPLDFKIGKGIIVRPGDDVLILSTGGLLPNAISAANLLDEEGISAEVVSMHTLKPFDKDLLEQTAQHKRLVVTLEEHVPSGGLSSIVSKHLLASGKNCNFLPISLPDSFATVSGSQTYLRDFYGLSPEKISKRIMFELLEQW